MALDPKRVRALVQRIHTEGSMLAIADLRMLLVRHYVHDISTMPHEALVEFALATVPAESPTSPAGGG